MRLPTQLFISLIGYLPWFYTIKHLLKCCLKQNHTICFLKALVVNAFFTSDLIILPNSLINPLGYSLQHKGYKRYDPLNNKIYVTRRVIFYELNFPYAEMVTHSNSSSHSQSSSSMVPYIPVTHSSCPYVPSSSYSRLVSTVPSSPLHQPSQSSSSSSSKSPLRCKHVTRPLNHHLMVTRSKAGVFKSKIYYVALM